MLLPLLLPAFGASAAPRACDGTEIQSLDLHGAGDLIPTTPPSAPTFVDVSLQIAELGQIDELTSTFRFEGYGDFQWCDPRAAFDAEVEGQGVRRYLGISHRYPVWNVELSIANGTGAIEVTRRLIEVHADGHIRVSGYFSSIVIAPFDLRLFPLDRQTLEIQIESFTYNGEMVSLRTSNDRVSYAPNLFLPEWRIVGIDARVDQTENVRDSIPFSRAVIALHIEREWGFYLFKLWIPLFLIVALSWSVFWMHDESLAGRIRISAMAFLTVVAYQFAISGSLPKIAYLTLMDRLMIASFVLIALSALQSMPVDMMRETNPERAAALDRTSRWLFPLAYVSYIAGISITFLY